jgi:hypothetical protein
MTTAPKLASGKGSVGVACLEIDRRVVPAGLVQHRRGEIDPDHPRAPPGSRATYPGPVAMSSTRTPRPTRATSSSGPVAWVVKLPKACW